MSKKFTPGQTTANGCTQSTAPLFCCVNATSDPVNNIKSDDAKPVIASDAKQRPASFFLQHRHKPKQFITHNDTMPVNYTPPVNSISRFHFNTSRFMKQYTVKSGMLAMMLMIVSLFFTQVSHGQISTISNWNNRIHTTSQSAQTSSFTIPAGSGSNRLLVVAIAASRTTVGAMSVTSLTYGGQPLTSVVGDMATNSVQQHTQLYYLNNAGIQSAVGTTLSATVTGGTTRVTDVWTVVFDGVDQTAPITDFKTISSGTTQTSATFSFSPALTVNSGDQAIEIISSMRLGSTNTRTINYNGNWNQQDEQTFTTTDAVRNGIANRDVPGTNTTDASSTSFSSTALASMSGMSIKLFVPPTYTSVVPGGNWNSNATWNLGSPPTAGSNVVIATGAPVTLTANTGINVNNLTVNSSLDLGTFTAPGTGTGTLTVASGGTLLVGGTSNFPSGYATTSLNANSTVNYNNAGAQTVAAQTYGNLIISNSGTKTLAGATTVSTTLNLTGGILAAGNNLTMGATGTPLIARSEGSMTGTPQSNNDYDVTYTGNTKTAGSENAGSGLNTVTVNLTAGQTLTLDANRAPDGNLLVTSGTFDLSTFTINRSGGGGTLNVSNGAFLRIGDSNPAPTNYSTRTFGATSTVEYYGTGTQNIGTETFGNLLISAGTKTTTGTVTVAGNFNISAGAVNTGNSWNIAGDWNADGTFNQTGGTTTFTGGGTHTLSGAGFSQFNDLVTSSQTINAGSHDIRIAGNWTHGTAGVFNSQTSTVTFNGTGNQTQGTTTFIPSFYNLTINKSAGTLSSRVWTVNNNLRLQAGNFSPADGSTFNAVFLSGGTLNTPATGTITASGILTLTANSILNLGAGVHTLSFGPSSAATWTGGALLTVNGWQGDYNSPTGSSGTSGRIFVGTTNTDLTAAQLLQIQFFNGVGYQATTLVNGEVTPYIFAPTGLSYSTPPTYNVGTSITPLSPTVNGTVTNYSATLPAGLSIHPTTGVISGTPTAAAATAAYTVTASNAAGSTTFDITITVNAFISAATDIFQTKASGDWSDFTTVWESSHDNGATFFAATFAPTNANGTITILTGHTVSVTADVSVDQVTVNSGGIININSGIRMTVTNDTGTDLNINATGNVNVNGFLRLENSATITSTATSLAINNGGTFEYNYTTANGQIPTASYNVGSTCKIMGITSASSITNLGQTFNGDFLWDCPLQTTASLPLQTGGFLGVASTGTMIVNRTGTGSIYITSTTSGTPITVGKYLQTGGNVILNNGNASRTFTVIGDFTINQTTTTSTFQISSTSGSSGTGNSQTLNIGGNFSMSAGTISSASDGSNVTANLNFNGTGVQTFSKTGGAFSGTGNAPLNIRILSGATVNFGTAIMDAPANVTFNILSGGTLITANTNATGALTTTGNNGTIQVGGTRTYANGANYVFNGAANQVAGAGLSQNTPANVTINTPGSSVTLTANTNMSGVLSVTANSTLALSTFNLGATTAPSSVLLEAGAAAGSAITGTTGTLSLGGGVTVSDAAEAGAGGASISSLLALGSAIRTFSIADDGTSATDLSISNTISGSGGVIKAGPGTMTYLGAFNYTGSTQFNAGELKLNPTTNVTPNTQFIFNGGTMSTVGIATGRTITNASTLNLNSGTSIIDLDPGLLNDHTIKIAPSDGVTWNGVSLIVNNWQGNPGFSGTAGKIFFGGAAGTLTSAQLAKISFTGFPGIPIILIGTGEIVPQPAGPVLVVTGNTTHATTCVNSPATGITYTITNVGGSQADGVTVNSDNSPEFAVSGFTQGITIPANGTATYTVTFTPASNSNPRTAAITIANTTDANIVTSNLTGNGVAQPTASASATSNTICITGNTAITGNTPAVGTGTGAWSILAGSPSTSNTQLGSTSNPSTTFTPSGGAGTYTIRWTVSNAPCTAAVSDVVIVVNALATASAGTPLTVCSSATGVSITTGAIATNFSSVLWTSSGSAGTITNATSLAGATYTPSTADISAGSVTLTLTAFGNAPCANATSNKILTITPAPTANNVTICQGSTAPDLTAISLCTTTVPASQTFNSNGTFTVPGGVTSVTVEAWGGGGGGGATGNGARGGGGGGAYATRTFTGLSGGIPVVVGTGGTAGNNGNPSSFNTTGLVANGGSAGTTSQPGGAGGTAPNSGTYTNFVGGNGGNGLSNNGGGGGGGSATAAGPGGVGGNATNANGAAGGIGQGNGGAGGNDGAVGNPGIAPGGGGGGRGDNGVTSGTGAAGRVIVTYSTTVTGTFSWYTALSGGTLLQTNTSPSFNPNPFLPNGVNTPPGTYTFYVECSGNPGCRQPVSVIIEAAPNPSIAYDFDTQLADTRPSPVLCSNEVIDVYANALGGLSVASWSTDNGTGTFASYSNDHVIYQPGANDPAIVHISFTTTDPPGICGPVTKTLNISVNQAATVNAGSGQTICSNTSAQLAGTANSHAGQVTWVVESGGTGTFSDEHSLNSTFTPTSGTAIILRLESSDPDLIGPCAIATDHITINVNPAPVPAVSGPLFYTEPVCPGGLYDFEGSVTSGTAPFSYTWTSTGNRTVDGVTSVAPPAFQVLAGNHATDNFFVSFKVTDANGCFETFTKEVEVNDTEDPVITCPIAVNANRNTAAGICTYTAVLTEFDATATDNCTATSLTYTLSGVTTGTGTSLAGVAFNKGTTTVTWTATDASGNDASCSFTVTVSDNEDPTITCVGNQTKSNDAGECTYTAQGTEFNPTAFGDNCPGSAIAYTLSGATTGSGSGTLNNVAFNEGVTTVTWTVTDASGNDASCTFTVTVSDNEDPTITCVGNQTKSNDAGECTYTAQGTEFNPTAFGDNCPGSAIAYTLSGATTGSGSGTLNNTVFNEGVTTVTWTVTDASGNDASCTFTVTVNDNEDPTITCVGNQTKSNDTGECTYTAQGTEFNPTAFGDNCPGSAIAYTLSGATTGSGSGTLNNVVFNEGVTTVTWTVTDASGNDASCTFTVTVNDNEDPTITCVGNQTKSNDAGECTYTAQGTEFNPTAFGDNCPGSAIAYTLSGATTGSGSGTLNNVAFNEGVTTVTWTVTDASGNDASCTFTVTVSDNEDPTITCVGNQTKSNDAGECTYTAQGTEFNPTAFGDNCPGSAIAYTLSGATTGSGSGTLNNVAFNEGVTTVTWTVTDASGNDASCTFTVTVSDNEDPTITCVGNQTKSNDAGECTYTAQGTEFNPTAFGDNCPGSAIAYTLSGATTGSGSGTLNNVVFNEGVTTVTWTVTDASGNDASCTFTVTVNDNEDPTITCVGNQTKSNDAGECTYTAQGTEFNPTAFGDNCPGSAIAYTLSGATTGSGSGTLNNAVFNEGVTTVTWTVTDASGNDASCTFTVTVNDNEDPTITCVGNQTKSNDAGECTYTAQGTEFNPTAFGDNCPGSAIAYTLSGATTGSGSGTLNNVAFNEGVTTVTWTVTDASGNDASCTFTVTVSDNEDPTITCVGNQTKSNDAGECTYTAQGTEFNPTAFGDNCPGSAIAYTLSGATTGSGSGTLNNVVFNEGVTTVTWTVTDASGNDASCTFTVTVNDNEDPTITCVGNQTKSNDAGECTYTAQGTEFNPTAFGDNCPGSAIAYTLSGATTGSGSGTLNNAVFNEGVTTVTWTVTDASGNDASCTFTVTVNDNEDPTITCVGNQTKSNDAGECTYTAQGTEFNPTAFGDNCPGSAIAYTLSGATTGSGSGTLNNVVFNEGVTTVTWTVTDASGNDASCTFTVTVSDNEDPTITCVGNQTKSNDAGECTYTAQGTEFNPTAFGDNCPGSAIAYTLSGATTGSGSGTLNNVVFNEGVTTVTWTVTDASGNDASCTFTVTVSDNEDPTITCVGNQTKSNDAGECTYTAQGTEFNPTAFGDNCPGSAIAYTLSGATTGSGSGTLNNVVFNEGVTTVTWTVTDASGNDASCTFTVTVNDNEDPTITCVGNQTKSNDAGECTYTAQGTEFNPTAFGDNCPGSAIAYTLSGATTGSGSGTLNNVAFNEGVTTVTWTVTDASGNDASCTFTVTVSDNEDPTITCVGNQTKSNDAGECTYTAQGTEFNPTAFGDNCPGSAIAYTLSGATTGSGSGTLNNTAFNEGVTTVTWTVTDASGNDASCTFTVTVSDNEDPTITCVGNQTKSNDAGECTYTAQGTEFNPTAFGDNCPGSAIAYTLSGATTGSGSGTLNNTVFNKGVTTVTWTVTDASGNDASCTFTVTVSDTEAPQIICAFSGNEDRNPATGTCGYTAEFGEFDATATDNCSVTSISYTLTGATMGTGVTTVNGVIFGKGVTTVTWTASDGVNNSTCSFTVTVIDNQPPQITCPIPGNANRNADAGLCTYTAQLLEFNAAATDNCAVSSLTYNLTGATSGSGTSLTGVAFNKGVTTVTWTASDGVNANAVCSFTVTVIDNQPPVINNLPANFSVDNLADNCLALVSWIAPTATDNCAMSTLVSNNATYNQFGFALLPVGVHTIMYTATDAAGNTATGSFTVTVKDVQPPTITGCPGNISTSSTTNICGAQVIYQQPTATDNCSGSGVTMTINNPAYLPGSIFPVGMTTVTWTATDASGNFSTCSFTVTVTDGTPPAITCPANISSSTDPGLCSALLTIAPATATDNCPGTVTVAGVRSDGMALNQPFPGGITTITWTATDLSNNSSTCTQTVTVTDTQKPTLTCPANIMTGSGSNICGAVVNYPDAMATDNCTASNLINVVYSMPSGSTFPLGTTTVTVTATDAANNSSTCTFTVTVTDQTAPVLTCPATVYVNNTIGFCGAFATYPAATATDNCTAPGAIIITYSQVSGTYFPVGSTPVMVTATDANGNSSNCTFNVVVADAQAPSITCPSNIIVNNDPGQCGALVTFAATATDNCPGTVISYSKNPNTLFAIGTTTVTVTATDAANNTSTCTFTVTVNDTEVPVITCQPDITVNAPVGQCSAFVTIVNATATDNCLPFVGKFRSDGMAITAAYPVGTTTITWFALDAGSNQATCTQRIIVKDATPPSITCPATVVVNNTVGQCGASVNPGTPTVTDDCSSTTYAGVRSDFLALNAIFPVGTTTITWTATDGSGNTASCIQAITVIDAQDPAITCNPSINTTNDPNQCGASLTINAPGATDNCPGVTVTGVRDDGQPLGALYPIGQTVITWTAKDAANRTASCTQTVNVTDIQSPIITCPPNLTVNVDAGQCSAVVGYTAQVQDNCPGTTLSFSPISGSAFPIGTTTVIATATDAAGNTAICAFTVTVVDNIPPTITCPANITVFNTPNTCGAAVNFPAATVSDNCSGVTTTYSPASGSIFPIGTTTVTATAKDASNNTSTCTFTVTVVDNQTPTISCPGNQSAIAEPGVCGANVTFLLTIGDNCPGLLTINQSHQSGQFFPVGVTTVTVTATDLSNNTATCTFTVTVTDGQAPNLIDPADITLPVLTGCSRVISLTPPTATDNCAINGAGVIGSNIPVGNIFPIGTTTITWTVSDVNGNTSSVTQNVTVNDQLAPVPDVASLPQVTGTCTATASAPTATDNCEGLITGTTTDPTTYNTPGTHTITWTYTDSKGNTSTQTQLVIVNADGGVINTQPLSASACVGETVTLTISATGGLQWQVNTGSGWNNLGGATTSGLQLLNVTAGMNGYQYRVIASGSCGNTISDVATLTVNAPPVAFAMTGGGSYCSGPGVNVGLASSQIGVNYQLFKDGSTPIGAALAGNGQPLGFGFQANGAYTVVATNASTGCTNNMIGSAAVTTGAPPTAFSMTGGGSYCNGPGVSVGISGSQTGVNYVLVRNGSTSVGLPFPGTGLAMDFGPQTDGVYTVIATNTTTGCTNNMNGSATVAGGALPTAFSVTGGGYYCGAVGAGVGLSGSQTGVNYQLMRNGSIPVGSAVAGTNAALGFGNQTVDGVYTVIATNATTACINAMIGSANVEGGAPPTAFNVTGGGNYCGATGVAVGLSGSQTGVNYQLIKDGSTPVGSPVPGTNAAIGFGNQTAGAYTVIATNSTTGCTSSMTASANVTGGPQPTTFSMTGGGNYCSGPGVAVGLSGSQTGINYQLYRASAPVGSPVAGTNAAISFGNQTAGIYTVVATNAATSCTNNMAGTATVTGGILPTAFNVTGGGGYCSGAGLAIGLAGSQSGVSYQLFRGATSVGSPVAGTNAAISFTAQTILGTYTVVATSSSTGCTNNMNGSAVIGSGVLPTVFNMTGGGGYCSGAGLAVGLSGSQSGVNYQLKRGTVSVGSPVAGTGSALAFTPQTVIGNYTVTATNASTGCTAPMNGTAAIITGTLPNLFTVTVLGTGYTCASTVQLSGSQTGVNYQLKAGAANIGGPVAGTGALINFGSQSAPGYYTVVATMQTGGCSRTMTGSPTITAAHPPTVYNVIGGGAACGAPGVSVAMSNSQVGVNYQLLRNGSPIGSPVAGVGGYLSFGLQLPPAGSGQYTFTATAYNPTTGCSSTMKGSATISKSVFPNVYNVSGGGTYCAGGTPLVVRLSSSQTLVRYQLLRNGSAAGLPSMIGTGGQITFSNLTLAGTYTIQADHTQIAGCTISMNGSATISCTLTRPAGPAATEPVITKAVKPVLNLSIAAFPNPSEGHFNVTVSSPVKETVEVRMFDMQGRMIEIRRGAPDQTFRFGDAAAAGMYIIEARQSGIEGKAQIKVIKAN